jgi:pyridoxine 5'-phosphate synthase PdxJ
VTNYAAHGLTKATVKQIMDRVWIKEILAGIGDVVILEQSTIVS